MASCNRPQASRGSCHGLAGRRVARAKKDKPEAQSAAPRKTRYEKQASETKGRREEPMSCSSDRSREFLSAVDFDRSEKNYFSPQHQTRSCESCGCMTTKVACLPTRRRESCGQVAAAPPRSVMRFTRSPRPHVQAASAEFQGQALSQFRG